MKITRSTTLHFGFVQGEDEGMLKLKKNELPAEKKSELCRVSVENFIFNFFINSQLYIGFRPGLAVMDYLTIVS